jgi:hypothetical protein
MVLLTLKKAEYHCCRDVRLVHQTMQDSQLSHSRELVEITRSVIITIGADVQYPCGWSSVLPQSDNLCNGLPMLIQRAESLSYYRII